MTWAFGAAATPPPVELYAFEVQVAVHASNMERWRRWKAAFVDVALRACDSPLLTTMIAGGCAGTVSRTVTAPLDRMKVLAQEGRVISKLSVATSSMAASQQQNPSSSTHLFTHPTVLGDATDTAARTASSRVLSTPSSRGPGLRDLCRYIYQNGGVAAFWRGNGVNCLKAGPEQAAAFSARQFYVSNICQDPSDPTFAENCAVGSLAGVTAQALLYPMEVVKTRMAVAECHEYSGIADCFRQSVRRGGFRDLYVGLGANIVGIVPHRGLEMGTFFTLHRAARHRYGEHAPPLIATMGISFVASMVSQVVTYPLNLARTRLQTQGVGNRPILYNGLVHCLLTVWRQDGFRGLFVGITPNMMKAVPSSMLMYMVFSTVMNALEDMKQS